MKRKEFLPLLTLVIGLGCAAASFLFRVEEWKVVSGTLIGIGAGLVGMSISRLVMVRMEHKHPELAKQNEIEQHDERNTMIRNRAKARAGDITQWLIMGIAWLTIFISAPLWVTLVVVGVFLVYNVIGLYLMSKYEKEM